MAAYADPYSAQEFGGMPDGGMGRPNPEDLVRQAMYGGLNEAGRGGKETLGLGSGEQQEGDTLQTATEHIRQEGIGIIPFFDEELGMVIGEATEMKELPPRQRKKVAMQTPVKAMRAAPPPPPETPKREDMFGIGMKVADDPPHKILAVNNLRDNFDRSINHLIKEGDVLEAVDGNPVVNLMIDELETFVFGRKGTMADLSLRKASGQIYNVQAKRHMPVQFALGMSITTEAPHVVMRVDELLDGNNNNISHMVTPGDFIEKVNGTFVEQLPIKRLEAIIFGPIDSTLIVTFKSQQSGQTYDVTVKRHVPVVTWLRWEEQGGRAAPSPQFILHAPPPPPSDPSPIKSQGDNKEEVYGFDQNDVTGEFI